MAHTRDEVVDALAPLPDLIGGIVSRTERLSISPEIEDDLKRKIADDWRRANDLLTVYGLGLVLANTTPAVPAAAPVTTRPAPATRRPSGSGFGRR